MSHHLILLTSNPWGSLHIVPSSKFEWPEPSPTFPNQYATMAFLNQPHWSHLQHQSESQTWIACTTGALAIRLLVDVWKKCASLLIDIALILNESFFMDKFSDQLASNDPTTSVSKNSSKCTPRHHGGQATEGPLMPQAHHFEQKLPFESVPKKSFESNQLSNPTCVITSHHKYSTLLDKTTTVPLFCLALWFFPGVHWALFAFLHWPSRSLHGAQSLVLVSLICMAWSRVRPRLYASPGEWWWKKIRNHGCIPFA